MNSYTIRAADMFDRIERCMLENPITPALPRFTAARGELTAAIAEAAKVTEPILYRHFKSKQELFIAIARAMSQ